MESAKFSWISLIGSPVASLSVFYVLWSLLPPGIALTMAIFVGLAVRKFRDKLRLDALIAAGSIGLAFGVAQWFPEEQRGFIALIFVMAGAAVGILRRNWRLRAEASE